MARWGSCFFPPSGYLAPAAAARMIVAAHWSAAPGRTGARLPAVAAEDATAEANRGADIPAALERVSLDGSGKRRHRGVREDPEPESEGTPHRPEARPETRDIPQEAQPAPAHLFWTPNE